MATLRWREGHPEMTDQVTEQVGGDEPMSALQCAMAAFDRAEQALQREDHADAEHLRRTLELYSSALSHAGAAPASCDSPADHDVLRAALLQQRARALSAIVAVARQQPLSQRQLDIRRRARWAVLLLVVSLVSFGGWLAYDRSELGNVALGKPWTASSQSQGKPLSGTLTNSAKHFFFHTSGQEQPWIEIDLGEPTRVSSLAVVNRDDCCQNRALPLVLEASSDHVTWRELARRTQIFDTWHASFDPAMARWVRLRASNVGVLHLKRIVIR